MILHTYNSRLFVKYATYARTVCLTKSAQPCTGSTNLSRDRNISATAKKFREHVLLIYKPLCAVLQAL
jgi:hypothetical protein